MPFLGAGYVLVLSATTLGVAAAIAEQKQSLENTLRAYYLAQGRVEREAEPRPDASTHFACRYSTSPLRPAGD